MWDNVGEMPLEIFGDYISDMLNQEWSWEYLGLVFNLNGTTGSTFGAGGNHFATYNGSGFTYGFHFNDSELGWIALGFGRSVTSNGDGNGIGEEGTGLDHYGFECWRYAD